MSISHLFPVIAGMGKVTLTILDRNNRYLDLLSQVLDTTRSQVINDVLEHMDAEDLESDFWDNWDSLYFEYKGFVESVGAEEEEEVEEESEEELEEEEEEED